MTPASRRKNVLSVEGLPLNRPFNCLPLLIETKKIRRRLRRPPPPLVDPAHDSVLGKVEKVKAVQSTPTTAKKTKRSESPKSSAKKSSAVDHQLKI